MSDWRVAHSLETLRAQVNALYPDRDKSSDGTIGDERHAATKSEHNPDGNGVVRAMDISHDPAHGLDARKLAEALVASRDPRILYLISNAQIISSKISPWQWRPYNGVNAHRHHMHISVVENPALYDATSSWVALKYAAQAPPVAKAPTSIRSNNPGALNAAGWVKDYPGYTHEEITSYSGKEPNHTAFFDTPEHGVAAWWELMNRYQDAGATTVHKIITKYGGGQDYREYENFVAKRSGLSADEQVPLEGDDAVLLQFAKAMWRWEAGVETPVPDDIIRAGFGVARTYAVYGKTPPVEDGMSKRINHGPKYDVPTPDSHGSLFAKIGGFFTAGGAALLYDWRVVSLILFAVAVFIAFFVPRDYIRALVGKALGNLVEGKK